MRPMIIISPRPLLEHLPKCAPPPGQAAAPRLTYLPFPAARGRRRRSPFPTASSPAGRKPPQLARRGLRKPTGRQPLPQQLASRVLKPPKDLGKDRRFNPISIAPTLPSTLTRFFPLWSLDIVVRLPTYSWPAASSPAASSRTSASVRRVSCLFHRRRWACLSAVSECRFLRFRRLKVQAVRIQLLSLLGGAVVRSYCMLSAAVVCCVLDCVYLIWGKKIYN